MSSASMTQTQSIERAISTRQNIQALAGLIVTAGDADLAYTSAPTPHTGSPMPTKHIIVAHSGDHSSALIEDNCGYMPTLDDFEDAVAIESGMGSVGIDHREKYRVPLIATGLQHPRPVIHYVAGQAIVDVMDVCAQGIVLAQERAAYLSSYWGRYASGSFASVLYAPGTCAPAVLADDYVGADWYYDNVQTTFVVPEDEDDFDPPRSVYSDVASASSSTPTSSSSGIDILSSLAASDVRTEEAVLTAPTSLLSASDIRGTSAAHKPRPRGESLSTWAAVPDPTHQLNAIDISISLPIVAVTANLPAVAPIPARRSVPSAPHTHSIAYHSDAFWDLALGRTRYRGMVDEVFGGSMLLASPTINSTPKIPAVDVASSTWVPQCPNDFFCPSWDEDLLIIPGETQTTVATTAAGLDVEP